MPELGWIIAGIALVGLVVLGVLLRRQTAQAIAERLKWERRAKDDISSARANAQAAAKMAEERAREALEDAERRRTEMEAMLASQRQELRDSRAAQERRESRLHEREDRLSAEAEGLVARAERLDAQRIQLRDQREEIRLMEERATAELERIAALTMEDARHEVVAAAERQAKLTATTLARDIEATAKRDADRLARGIITTAIQRVASEQTSESVVSTVDLPSDDMKGRIIGREGRNIRAFEQITGVNVLIDDTPESVLLSSFDPVRRETARITLVDLIADGRIHPARIEEVHDRSVRRINERVLRATETAH